jgi:hypothetical protein
LLALFHQALLDIQRFAIAHAPKVDHFQGSRY